MTNRKLNQPELSLKKTIHIKLNSCGIEVLMDSHAEAKINGTTWHYLTGVEIYPYLPIVP